MLSNFTYIKCEQQGKVLDKQITKRKLILFFNIVHSSFVNIISSCEMHAKSRYCILATCLIQCTIKDQLIRNESVPIQLAQCRSPELAISNAKILIYFSNKIYRSNFIKQHTKTVIVLNYQNADCSLIKKFIVSFNIIFSTLSFPIDNERNNNRQQRTSKSSVSSCSCSSS